MPMQTPGIRTETNMSPSALMGDINNCELVPYFSYVQASIAYFVTFSSNDLLRTDISRRQLVPNRQNWEFDACPV